MIGKALKRITATLALASIFTAAAVESAMAQNTGRTPTTSRIEYHGGAVEWGTSDVYLIFYGCWADTCGAAGDTRTMSLLADFASSVGGTPYFQINRTYPSSSGSAPGGGLLFAGSLVDSSYSHGVELSVSDVQTIITEKITTGALPQDPAGIYVVIASADVGSAATGFCVPSAPPFHGYAPMFDGIPQVYAFIGNPIRCPAIAAPQFFAKNARQLPTPNGNFAGDSIASTLTQVLNNIMSDPRGDGWFDRYGLEAGDKCADTYGQTYLTPGGAQANIHLWIHDFLIPENWVNDGKGRCAMQ
jgi:hypothetical protein